MIVERSNFMLCLDQVGIAHVCGLDTETTGLQWWKDELFSVIVRTEREVFYFNFNWQPDHLGNFPEEKYLLPRAWIPKLGEVLSRPSVTLYGSNAKFDMHMLANEGVWLDDSEVVDFQSRERILRNSLFPFEKMSNLANLSKHYGAGEKSEAVEEYISKHKLYTDEEIPGKKKAHRNKRYNKVPLGIVAPYGCTDGDLHYKVGTAQAKELCELNDIYSGGAGKGFGTLLDVDTNERRLLSTCFRMEREGIKVNVNYTKKALAFEESEVRGLKTQFQQLTGLIYTDSEKCFVPAFERLGLSYPRTAKGNPSFNADVLETVANPVANLISGIRGKEKQIGTYYSSFLHFKDDKDVLHADIKQWGTETGRMSYANPNLQNVPKQEDEEDRNLPYHVRGCFVPDTDFCFVSIDYSQQEFRMILDYAGETELIEKINAGYDPHQAVSDETGLSRREAKVFNFGIAYGMGPGALGTMLGVPTEEAADKLNLYFRRMRNVRRLIWKVGDTARVRGYVRNWLGRVLKVNDPQYNYVLFNHLIQGGCGDVCKIAMNLCDDRLRKTRSKLLVQVHDELLFKVHKSELEIVPELKQIMDTVYKPRNGMLMPTSVDHSWKSWSYWDKTKGLPSNAINQGK